jgi:hypothetical protein
MAWSKAKRNVVEMFRIQSEGFNLWAALISLENDKFMVCGGTRSEKGDVVSFHSEISDRDTLRDRLLSACAPIAAFYGVEVMHREIERQKGKVDAFTLLAPTSEWVH